MALSFSVNWLAVLVAAVVSMFVGFLWYGPLFGKQWMRLMGFGKKDIDKAKQKGMAKSYVTNFIAGLVTAFVLAVFISSLGMSGWDNGLTAGFWIWLGFLAPVMLGSVLWEGKPFKLYVLNTSYWLINLLIMGMILGIWS